MFETWRRPLHEQRAQAGRTLRGVLAASLAVLLAVPAAAQQTRTVTGRVTDAATGQPLIGAEVSLAQGGGAVAVQGRGATSVTTQDGTFTIQVPTAQITLMIRMLGYKRADVTVPAGQNAVEVQLETDPLNLDEIVVTGQATGVQRRNLANAVSTVNANDLNVVPTASIETQLYGKVAGADIQSNSGAPGGGNQISLRGVNTILGNSTPLYVVDGVIVSDVSIPSGANSVTGAGGGISNVQDNAPNRIADLNPADIENIEILKGASAAAIYGSKANNGVIVITTRRGRAGDTQFNLRQRVGFSKLAEKIGTRQFETLEEAVDVFGPSAEQYFVPGRVFDLEDQLAGRSAPAYETQLDISGGTETTRYFVSGLIHDEEGIITGTFYDKYSARINLDQTLGDKLNLGVRMYGLRSKGDRGFTNNDNTSTSYYMIWSGTPSFLDLRQRADGTFPLNPYGNSNPLQTAALAENQEQVDRFTGGLTATYDLLNTGTHGLRLLANGGADVFAQTNNVYTSEDLQFECQTGDNCTPIDPFPGTSVLGKHTSTLANFNVNAVHSWTPATTPVSATTSLGVQYEYRDLDVSRVQATDLFPGQQNVNQAVNRVPEQIRSRTKDFGLFAQEELLVGERLLLTGSVRADRSSNNADPEEWFVYPKAAGSYRLVVGNSLLDEVKFRGAWGQSGNQPLYGQKFNNLNPGRLGGFQTLTLGGTTVAADLHPERQTELEGGIDAYLFGGRASLELTAYHKRIDDVLLARALPPSTGFNQALFNSDGYMTTDGFEAAVFAVPVDMGGFVWQSRTTFSRDETVMDSLPVPPFNFGGGGFGTSLGAIRIEQGYPVTGLWGRDTVAVADDPACLKALKVDEGSGQCDVGDRYVGMIGNSNPDFRMGFSNDFRYRSLSLSTTVDWQKGGDVVNLTGYLLDANRISPDFDAPCSRPEGCGMITVDGVQRERTMGEYRLAVYPARTSRVFLEDASFVKLREVALTWDVPASVFDRAIPALDGLSLTVSGRNLLTITDYTGFDPEVNNFGAQAIRGNIDVAPYPPSRSFWLSLDARF